MNEFEISEGTQKRKWCSARVPLVALVCSLIIAIGLGLGLGFGLRHYTLLSTQDTTNLFNTTVCRYRFGVVAADAEICSSIGTDIMAFQGGSAIDGAIAAMLCVGVYNFQSTGLGGGAFAIVYNKSLSGFVKSNAAWFNYREKAPIKASQDMYVGKAQEALSLRGGLAIAVPGELKGYMELHKLYGKVKWSALFQPVIKLARDGFKVGLPLAEAAKNKWKLLSNYTELKNLLTRPDGSPIAVGDIIKRPTYANTLEEIANDPDSFYNGSLAEDIIQDLQEYGSIITRKDLQEYEVARNSPLVSSVGLNTLVTGPPPSSGALIHYLFHIMQGFNLTSNDIASNEKTILTYHRIIEAMKYAYAKRSFLGDIDYVNITDVVLELISPKFGEKIRKQINDLKTFPPSHYGANFDKLQKEGTSHISAIDQWGTSIAMTSTINLYFGSCVMGKRTGILFNDEMDDFSTPGAPNIFGIPPSRSNFIAPGKRPMSSMSPSILVNKDGDVILSVGASGGTRIITAVFMVMFRSLYLQQSLGESIDSPRIHHQLIPDTLVYDSFINDDVLRGLRQKGHKITTKGALSIAQAIQKIGRYLYGASDNRKHSKADGF